MAMKLNGKGRVDATEAPLLQDSNMQDRLVEPFPIDAIVEDVNNKELQFKLY